MAPKWHTTYLHRVPLKANRSRPCSELCTLTLLCMGRLKVYARRRIGASRVLRLEGSANFLYCASGMRQRERGFTWQMVLSSARRGSLPSALTRLSLPTAIPLDQSCLAALRPPSTCFIHPEASSSASREDCLRIFLGGRPVALTDL